jgi:hypothetical protein
LYVADRAINSGHLWTRETPMEHGLSRLREPVDLVQLGWEIPSALLEQEVGQDYTPEPRGRPSDLLQASFLRET